MLLGSKKEQLKEPPEPTQQELVVKAAQEEGFTKTVDVGQLFRTRPVCDTHGSSTAPYCKYFTRRRSIEGSMKLGNRHGKSQRDYPWKDQNWFRFRRLRLRGSEVPCALSLKCRCHRKWQAPHGHEEVVEFSNGHVNHQNSQHRLKEWMFVLLKEAPQSPRPSPKIWICAYRETDCVSFSATTTQPMSDSDKPSIEGAIAFQSPVHGKDTSKQREIQC